MIFRKSGTHFSGSWFLISTGERRGDAGEEQPRDREPDPDDEAEQADDVDGGELADALLPQPAEVREKADREERENEEDDAERVGLAHRRQHLGGEIRRRAECEIESDREGDDEAE